MRGYVREEYDPRAYELRILILAIAVVLLCLVVLTRLWRFQVVLGAEYALLSQGNVQASHEIPAARGLILSARGERLAEGGATWDIYLTPSRIPKESEPEWDGVLGIIDLANRLDPLLPGLGAHHIVKAWEGPRGMDRERALRLKRDLSWEQASPIRARAWSLTGIELRSRARRVYPKGALFAHVVGYLRELRSDQLRKKQLRYRGTEHSPGGRPWYELGDLVGTEGLERQLEEWLKGHDGLRYSLRDAWGRELEPETSSGRALLERLDRQQLEPTPGHNIETTLRADLQELARKAMGEESGAVAMVEARTGRVLVYLSLPSYEPSIFASRLPPEVWAQLRDDPRHPLLDKVVAGTYPPGSTYKPFVAAAALASGLDPDFRVHCNGFSTIGNERKRCWKWRSGGHGEVDLYKAIVQSCDTWFYQAGLSVGMERLAEKLAFFGFGQKTGVHSNPEKRGILPTPSWSMAARGDPWQRGDTASAAIGQGYVLTTPLQLAVATAALANGGKRYAPWLVDRVVEPRSRRVVVQGQPHVLSAVEIEPAILRRVQEAMVGVVEDPRGTARRQRTKLRFGGKTGTAQVVRQTLQSLAIKDVQKSLRDHALFIAFAPAEDPEIAVAVVVEHGEHGSSSAAPIARALIDAWWADREEKLGGEE